MLNASATAMVPSFLGAIGSHKHFTTYTIDQSAKSISLGRIGMWNAPRHPLHDSDVRMMFGVNPLVRSEEHTSELQSLMRISYAVFCLKKKNIIKKSNKSISKK